MSGDKIIKLIYMGKAITNCMYSLIFGLGLNNQCVESKLL